MRIELIIDTFRWLGRVWQFDHVRRAVQAINSLQRFIGINFKHVGLVLKGMLDPATAPF